MSLMCFVMLIIASPLDEPCPVDLRGVEFGEAVAELAGRLDVPYILDTSVTPEDLAKLVRMRAEYLTGGEVFVWLARSAGLEAVHRQGVFLLARPERLPLSWRARPLVGVEAAASARWDAAQRRRVDVGWLDTPLSQVAADVRRGFSLDLIAHPDVLAEQGLVTHTGRQMAVAAVCRVLAEQLRAQADVLDGVLWLRPAGESGEIVRSAATGPAGRASPGMPERESPADLAAEAVVDRRIRNWGEFVDCLNGGHVVFDISEHPGSRWPNLVARGPVEDILEGARLVGAIRWSRMPDGPPGRPAVVIEVLSPKGD